MTAILAPFTCLPMLLRPQKAVSPPRILTATEPVYLPDVYAHRLNAALVTLSACQSNIGPLARGEGVLGMGRAFAAAGAQGVVASLWMLNDRAAADVNDRFYEQLARGVSKPVALHQAQLDYLNRTDMPAYLKSPYYWAGLTYYGDANPLPTSPNLWWFVFPILIVLAAAWRFLRSRDKT
jgi:CHAT domain-containing protein